MKYKAVGRRMAALVLRSTTANAYLQRECLQLSARPWSPDSLETSRVQWLDYDLFTRASSLEPLLLELG